MVAGHPRQPRTVGVRLQIGESRRTRRDRHLTPVARRFDPEIFTLHGIDVTTYDVVGLKSSQHFRGGFRHLASEIVTADAPGLTTLDVTVFEHERATGAHWPHHPTMDWSPEG